MMDSHLAASKLKFEEDAQRTALLAKIRGLETELRLASGSKRDLDALSRIDQSKRTPRRKNEWRTCPRCTELYYKSYCDCRVEGLT